MRLRFLSLCVLFLLLASDPAQAFIERLYSLQEVMDESSHIYVGRLEKVDTTRRLALAKVERTLKGKAEFGLIKMNLGLGPSDHVAYLMGVLKEGQPIIVFVKRERNDIASCVSAGDTWFQLFSNMEADPSSVWWRLSHVEVAMGRTFHGTTPDLIRLTSDVLAGRAAPPKPDPSIPRLDVKGAKKSLVAAHLSAEPVHGLEAMDGWVAEQGWARPATLAIEVMGSRGKLLRARCDGQPGKKLALSLLQHVDLSQDAQFAALVDNGCDKPLAISVAFGSAPEWTMFESPAVTVPAGAKAVAVRFSLTARHFKCEASKWEHSQPMPNGGRVDKIMLIVEGMPEKGSVSFDRVGGARGGFRLAQEFPHADGEVRGIAWADVDGDDRLDAILCCGNGNLLLLNDGGTLKDATAQYGLKGGARAAAWADYDGDGHPDLLTSNFHLFTNVGGKLRDDSRLLPSPRERNPCGVGWIDYNGDGLPDILITNGEHGIRLFENTGKGPQWFRDVSDKVGLGPKGIGVGNGDFIACADYDGDGYTDFLYNLGDGLLAHNERGKGFKLDTRAGIRIGASNDHKLGIAFADYDNDGDLDLFVPGLVGGASLPRVSAHLYRNNNDGTFTDVIAASGDLAALAEPSVSAAWGDVNNDGFLDLFVCTVKGPGRLYLGDGKGGFKDVTAAAGPVGGASLPRDAIAFAASFADVDDDGDLDLVLNLERKAVVLINEMDRAADCGSLTVSIAVAKGLVGAVVRVADAKGRPMGLRELSVAEGCGGQAAPVAHFGLAAGRYQVSVCLTDGRVAQKPVAIEAGKAAQMDLDATAFK